MFKIQILTEEDAVVTEWRVRDDEDGSAVDIVKELAFLRKMHSDGRTFADVIAEASV